MVPKWFSERFQRPSAPFSALQCPSLLSFDMVHGSKIQKPESRRVAGRSPGPQRRVAALQEEVQGGQKKFTARMADDPAKFLRGAGASPLRAAPASSFRVPSAVCSPSFRSEERASFVLKCFTSEVNRLPPRPRKPAPTLNEATVCFQTFNPQWQDPDKLRFWRQHQRVPAKLGFEYPKKIISLGEHMPAHPGPAMLPLSGANGATRAQGQPCDKVPRGVPCSSSGRLSFAWATHAPTEDSLKHTAGEKKKERHKCITVQQTIIHIVCKQTEVNTPRSE